MPSKRQKRPVPTQRPTRGRAAFSRGGLRNTILGLTLPGHVATDGFTMRDEARNTTSHQTTWGQDAKLRHRPVAFVNAGFTEPLKNTPLALADQRDALTPESATAEDQITPQVEAILESSEIAQAGFVREMVSTADAESTSALDAQAVDSGDNNIASELTQENANPSAVNETGFFFDLEGDSSLASRPPPATEAGALGNDSDGEGSDSSEDVVLFKGRANMAKAKAREMTRQKDAANTAAAPVPNRGKGKSTPPTFTSVAIPSASSQPTIETAVRDPDEYFEPSRRRSRLRETARRKEEEDALIADYIANMAQDSEGDLAGQMAFSLSRDLGGEHSAFDHGANWASNLESGLSAEEQHLDSEGQEASEAGEGDDENLARLLSKQEELGLGSEELLLFSDSYTKVEKHDQSYSVTSRKASRISHALKGPYESANAVAEAFDSLDLTDRHQVSAPGASSHRNRQVPVLDNSDSELEARLRAAWHNDRERKKNRKMEREELRARGMLGKNVNPDDLRVKYPANMTLEYIKTDLRLFLISSDEALYFPPMDKPTRKMLHELAGKLKIKSHSTGSGDQRRPVLTRTKHTLVYSADRVEQATAHIEAASARIHRKYFHRTDNQGGHGYRLKDTAGGRSGGKAITYREGEIVGAAAPELGQENKGRAMLEKMGWSKGMALGSDENQGILEPVAQVVKRSKAGLG